MLRSLALLLSATLILSATTTANAADKNIVETAVAAESFETLVAAVKAAGLVDALQGEGPFTVFAPTDEAFAKLPAGTVENLLKPENKGQLVAILTYHVVSGKVTADQVVKLNGAKTLNGQQVDIKADKTGVTVDQANVVKTDILCSNGVIHVVDEVILPASKLIPEVAAEAGNFKTLLAAATAGGLVDALSSEGPLTVFAPTDAAFAKLPNEAIADLLKPENKGKLVEILKYHVVAGRVYSTDAVNAGSAATLAGSKVKIAVTDGVARVNNARLVATDLDASNGVIHVIDSVLMPPAKGHSAVQSRRMIEAAVNKGAPLYNSGHKQQCVHVYMQTAEALLANGGEMTPTATHALRSSLDQASQTHCYDSKAWTLRHGLDVVHREMSTIK